MTARRSRVEWLAPILKRVESRLGNDSDAAKSLQRDIDWARERDAEEALWVAPKPPGVSFDPSTVPVHRKDVAFREGECVTHKKRPDWGAGKVIADSTSESVRVLFEVGGERTLGLPLAALSKVHD